jgi:hypothetical protein
MRVGLVAGSFIILFQAFAFAADSSVVEQQISFSVRTANVDSILQKIIQTAESKGGYFTNYNNFSLSLRLPVSELQEFQKSLEGFAEITDKSFSSQDRKGDLERLNLQIQSRKKLLDAYHDLVKNAPLKELQSVEREMVNLNAQIEHLQGQKLAIEKRAALASVSISVSVFVSPVARTPSAHSPFLWINSTDLNILRRDF